MHLRTNKYAFTAKICPSLTAIPNIYKNKHIVEQKTCYLAYIRNIWTIYCYCHVVNISMRIYTYSMCIVLSYRTYIAITAL